jgi:hypothetical protein
MKIDAEDGGGKGSRAEHCIQTCGPDILSVYDTASCIDVHQMYVLCFLIYACSLRKGLEHGRISWSAWLVHDIMQSVLYCLDLLWVRTLVG